MFKKTNDITLDLQTEDGDLITLTAQQHLDRNLVGTSLVGVCKTEKDGTTTNLSNKIVKKRENVTLLQICNLTHVTVWQDYKSEKHANEPFCNIIIDNRDNIAQIAIERNSAFGGKEGPDKVKTILQDCINRIINPYGWEIEITRKMRSIKVWEMVEDRLKHKDPVKRVCFNFRDPAETQAIDATEKQLAQLSMMSALRKATGAVQSSLQLESSPSGTLLLDRAKEDLAGMVALCSNNGWDIDIHFRDFGVYRTGELQSAIFPLQTEYLNQFASNEELIGFEGPEGQQNLVNWLDKIRDITKEYDFTNESKTLTGRKGKIKR